MSLYDGVYKSFLQGVSQQTPQEREDGQLGEQVNMLSDPVTSLRRRGGVQFSAVLPGIPEGAYMEVVEVNGIKRVMAVDVQTGTLHVFGAHNAIGTAKTFQNDYLKATSKYALKTTSARGNIFIVNTEKIPFVKALPDDGSKNPAYYGYFSVRASQFSKSFTVTLTHQSIGEKSFTVTASDSVANEASPEAVAKKFLTNMNADTEFVKHIKPTILGTTIAFEVVDRSTGFALDVQSSTTGGYTMVSGTSRVPNRTELLGVLPPVLDGYIMAVGNTGNSAYYKYMDSTKKWREVGVYTNPYVIENEPMYWFDDNGTLKFEPLGIQPRSAGDEDNNPMPKFIGYGITGISAYQARLVILSGSYVNMSKTTDFNQFTRTSVTELLEDDPIEVSSAALSSAQFEYAVPFNKDLVLIARGQQAVIPANATVLTPRTAVIYPSTELDISLAVAPTVVSRTLYYTYQRGVNYYQVGEFIPNSYTDAQYYSQNLTDHIPLYAKGVCSTMASSSTNNTVVFGSGTTELLVNQFLWRGDERAFMSFHKWVLPYPVQYVHFVDEHLLIFMSIPGNRMLLGILDTQLNQLDTKPVPFADMYSYVDIVDGSGALPEGIKILPGTDQHLVVSIYDSSTMRHQEVQWEIKDGRVYCPYEGRVYIGLRFSSTFTLTPPFIKDDNGRVIAGTRSTLQSLKMTFKGTGKFSTLVQDAMGVSFDIDEYTAETWSEVDLGYTWINSVGAVSIPCRTRLASTLCTIRTDSTTDLNLVSTEYTVRIASKRRRI